MRHRRKASRVERRGDEGQVSIFVVLALGIFLLGFVGFGVDMTNLWYHRQTAQSAADAACQAGVMDLLLSAMGSPLRPAGQFPTNRSLDCSGTDSAYTPCIYARYNGYNSGATGGGESNQVLVSFPGRSDVPGVTPPDDSLAPVPFIRVDVIDAVRLYFASLLTASPTMHVRAFAVCGLTQATAPIPIIVLNPVCSHSFEVSGSATVRVVGGPRKSVQVNSNSSYSPGPTGCAAATTSSSSQCTSNGTIDLSQGGPNLSGSAFGTFGGQSPAPPGFMPGTTGAWQYPASPIQDPYKFMLPPDPASLTPRTTYAHTDPYQQDGCPDQDPQGCKHYLPGLYTQPIVVKNETAIFDPGVYYIAPTNFDMVNCGKAGCTDVGPIGGQCRADFAVDSTGVVRQSTVDLTNSGIGGTIFYLSSAAGGGQYGSVFFGANAGKYGGRIVDDYYPEGGLTSEPVRCSQSPAPQVPVPSPIKGNVLLAPCSGPYGGGDKYREMLFFQDRSNKDPKGQPSMQGGGGLLLAGTLYFHNCPNSTTAPCEPYNTDYNAFAQLQGTPGSETRIVGNITVDQLILAGNGDITMVLDANRLYNILKASLLR